jgi:hypothetical protein
MLLLWAWRVALLKLLHWQGVASHWTCHMGQRPLAIEADHWTSLPHTITTSDQRLLWHLTSRASMWATQAPMPQRSRMVLMSTGGQQLGCHLADQA